VDLYSALRVDSSRKKCDRATTPAWLTPKRTHLSNGD